MSGTAWTRTRAVLSLGMVLGLGAVGTLAAWSDSASATTGVFTTGNIQLKLDGNRPTHAFANLEKISMLRGNSVAAMLPVQNTGNTRFSYVARSNAGGDSQLASNLTVSVFAGGSSNGSICSGGSQISSTALNTGAPVNIIPSARTLNAGAQENLCFQVTLNGSAPDSTSMKVANASFTFTATAISA